MSMHTPSHKDAKHPAAQVPAPDRFLHPTLGPLVARAGRAGYCVALDGAPCAVFASRTYPPDGTECPNIHGDPSCHPHRRPDGKPIIWIRDPAYVQ